MHMYGVLILNFHPVGEAFGDGDVRVVEMYPSDKANVFVSLVVRFDGDAHIFAAFDSICFADVFRDDHLVSAGDPSGVSDITFHDFPRIMI